VLFAGGWDAAGLSAALALVSTAVARIETASAEIDDAATGWSDSLGRSGGAAAFRSCAFSTLGIAATATGAALDDVDEAAALRAARAARA
jgi:hypothetical protein